MTILRKKKTIIMFLCVVFLSATLFARQNNNPKKTTLEYRMGLNTHYVPLDIQKQDSILDDYIANGYGALATNVNWTDDYLKDESKIQSMFRFVKSAKSKGMKVWLYDENWYPSGMAGTYILNEHPEWECEGIFFKCTHLKEEGELYFSNLPGNIISIKAIPIINGDTLITQARDISLELKSPSRSWIVPKGEWLVAEISTSNLRDGFQAGTLRGDRKMKYPSLLMPEVCSRFIELTHKRYADVLGEKLSTLFYSTFTDEPSAMALPYQNLGFGVYPWKANVSLEYAKRVNRELVDDLLWILLDKGKRGQESRITYFQIISDLISVNYFKQIQDYCHAQGFLSGGHLLLEEDLMAHPVLYGDIMACYRFMDIPGIDVLTGMPEFTNRYLYSARMAASAAELEGRTMVMSEICPITDAQFHNGKEAPTNQVIGTINRQIIGGVSLFNNYLRLEHEDCQGRKAVNSYVSRVVKSLSKGVRKSRIAVYYPIETIWSTYLPTSSGLTNWDKVSGGCQATREHINSFENISNILYENQIEFNYIDAKGIDDAKIKNEKLCFDRLSWDVLILPNVSTIPEKILKKIGEFVKSGGKVIFLDTLPQNSLHEFPSTTIPSMLNEMKNSKGYYYFSSFDTNGISDLLSKLKIQDFSIDNKEGILLTHKVNGKNNILFICNDKSECKRIHLNINKTSKVELYNPYTDISTILEPSFDLELKAYEGLILKYKTNY